MLSGMRIVSVGDEDAKAASAMLISAGLHGHTYANDAAEAEPALRQHRTHARSHSQPYTDIRGPSAR